MWIDSYRKITWLDWGRFAAQGCKAGQSSRGVRCISQSLESSVHPAWMCQGLGIRGNIGNQTPKVDVGFVNQNSGFINQRFDNQGSTTKVRQLKTEVSSTKVRQPKSWIRQPRGSSTKKVGFVNQKRRIHQPRFVNQGSSTTKLDSSTKDSSTKRLDSSTKNGGFINQGSSTKNTDSSTKDSSTKRLDSSKNGGFEGSGTFLACLEVEKLSLTCRCCVSCS